MTGLINNVLYVIILSAALDLVGPNVPKGLVLLADVVPSFFTKLCAPYIIHLVPHPIRVIFLVSLSTCGMLLIALAYTDSGTITAKMAGVVLASLSSGGGELSFLGLTHYYGPLSLAAWGSGTGGAGLVGAGAYAVATTSLGLSVRKTLVASSLLPAVMLMSFFLILPRGPLNWKTKTSKDQENTYTTIEDQDISQSLDEDRTNDDQVNESLLQEPLIPSTSHQTPSTWQSHFLENLRRSGGLFFP